MANNYLPPDSFVEKLTPFLAKDLLESYPVQELSKEVATFLSLVITGDVSLEKEDRAMHLAWLKNKIETSDNPRLKEIFLLEQKRLKAAVPVMHGQTLKDIWSDLTFEELRVIQKDLRDDYVRILEYIMFTEDGAGRQTSLYTKCFYQDMDDELSEFVTALQLPEETQKIFDGSIRKILEKVDDADSEITLEISVNTLRPEKGSVSCTYDLRNGDVIRTSSSLQISPELLMRLIEHENCTIYELIGIKKKEIDRLWGEGNM